MNKTIEDIKNYWNHRPCNIRHSDETEYNKKFFDQVEERRYFVEPHILDFADFKRWKGKKVLEIGCGIGTDSKRFAEAGADLTVVDLSDKSLDICKKRFEEYGLQAKFYSGNSENLSNIVPIEKYDLIYSFGVIHHTTYPEKVLSEIQKYMSQDSEIRIMLYKKICWKTLDFFFWNGHKFGYNFAKTSQYFAEAQLNCPVAFFYSKNELLKLFKNYNITSIENKFIFPYDVKSYINKIYKKRFIFKLLPVKWLEKFLGQHWLITAKLKK